MIVKDLNEKLTARRVETSSWECVRLLLKSDWMGFLLSYYQDSHRLKIRCPP